MNYSTLKKTVALSFASLMAVGVANAQTDSTASTTTTTGTAKVFGGRGQYNTWSLGLNAGAVSPVTAIGGTHDYVNYVVSLGYGASLKWQLAHSFALQLDFNGGKVAGNNNYESDGEPGSGSSFTSRDGFRSYDTRFWQGTLGGKVNVATIDFLRRKNSVNFFVDAGAGMIWYNPHYITAAGVEGRYLEPGGAANEKRWVKSLVIPVGAGVKFRLSDALGLNLGYKINFTDDDNLDALKRGYPTKDRYSYGYGGLEYTFGSSSKANLEWVNPVALMYDELYDAALRQEVEALKGRVTNVENAVNDLKKDSDGDGVSDQFDKCPNTPAGTVVDGAGCPIKFPAADSTATATAQAYSNIQFDFDSSVLRTSSYSVLDAVSADMRATSGKTVTLSGYASSEGTAAHNIRLSKDRANSVKTYLVNSGVEAKRIKVKGLGETNPIADNSTEEGRVMNRRVEFKQM